jgi:hypothetical protein
MNQSIEKRLAELEAKQCQPERLDIFIVPAGEPEEAVTGFSCGGGVEVLREPGESLEALQGRAAAAVPAGERVAVFRAIH